MVIAVLTVFIFILVLIPGKQKEQHMERKNAVKQDARLNIEIKRVMQREQQIKKRKKDLYNEFYFNNPNGTPWQFQQWLKDSNVDNKARHPQRFRQTVKKLPRTGKKIK